MKHENNPLNFWLAQVTRLIRFAPDRRAVEAELREHIEDKLYDIRRIYPDMSEEEAQNRALSQMGDAQEIAREMAKIHTPWLGYLWRASQLLLCLICIYAGWYWQDGISLWPGFEQTSFYSEGVEVFMREKRYELPEDAQPIKVPLPEPVRVGEYTISVVRADLWGRPDGQYQRDLYVILEVEYERLWESPAQFIDRVWAVDDRGNRIMSNMENWDDEIPYGPHANCISMFYKGPHVCRYEITFPIVDHEARQIDLKYTRFGVNMTISLDLTGGAP